MFLSRLLLDPRHAQAQTDLAAPYDLHRTLARAFADDGPPDGHRARHGVLFRIDVATPQGVPVLVQSTTAPDWARLAPGYALRTDGPKPLAPSFETGQTLRFRLVANPVRRTREEGKTHPVRLPLVHARADAAAGLPDGYLDWIERQTVKAGAEMLQVADAPFRVAGRRRRGPDLDGRLAKQQIPHFGVRFDGLLTVRDPEALARAVRDGIGPAKAFGFGLLSLAPAS